MRLQGLGWMGLGLLVGVGLAPGRARASEDGDDAAQATAGRKDAADDADDDGSEEVAVGDGGASELPSDGGTAWGIDVRCFEREQAYGPVDELLGGLRLEMSASHAPIQEVRLEGLATLDPKAVASLVGLTLGPLEGPLSPEVAAVVVARLAGTGLFENVTPQILEEPGPKGVLRISVREFPRVTRVEIRGLTESKPEDLLRFVLLSPGRQHARHARHNVDFHFHLDGLEDALSPFLDVIARARVPGCGWTRPPSSWVALSAGSTVVPGILWRGAPRALQRVVAQLHARGYLLATAQARLEPDGAFVIDVDEGKVSAVEVVGVHPRVEARVRQLLGMKAGDVLLASEVERGIESVETQMPYLEAVKDHTYRPAAYDVVTEAVAAGGTAFHLVLAPVPAVVHGEADSEKDDDADQEKAKHERHRGKRSRLRGAEIHDGRLVVYFEDHPWTGSEMDWVELIRHTQVTGFAPGLGGTLRYWDPGDRLHVAVDGQFNINTRRPSLSSNGDLLSQLGAEQRVDWAIGPKVQLPNLDLAEIGAQAHAVTDTEDRWHLSPLDSYLDSLWMNRAESDYFRRSGVWAYATGHIAERVTVGLEYRYDRYDGIPSLNHVWTVLNQGEHAYGNPDFASVEAGSVVGRVEFSTYPHPIEKVGDRRRDVERSLIKLERHPETGFTTVDTVEVADPGLGGTSAFTRVVSDSRLYLASGESSGLLMRLRGAGENGAVPLPKLEKLGGWDDLRGYEFDEFRGDRSILATVEYHWEVLGVFADAGDVRQLGGSWYSPRLGLGAELALGDFARVEVAWRTDSQATAGPSARLLFQRTF